MYVGFALYEFVLDNVCVFVGMINDDMKWYLVRMNDVHHLAELGVIN